MDRFCIDVTVELTEMKMIGMRVPHLAFVLATRTETMQDLVNMSVSDCADLLIQLADSYGPVPTK